MFYMVQKTFSTNLSKDSEEHCRLQKENECSKSFGKLEKPFKSNKDFKYHLPTSYSLKDTSKLSDTFTKFRECVLQF